MKRLIPAFFLMFIIARRRQKSRRCGESQPVRLWRLALVLVISVALITSGVAVAVSWPKAPRDTAVGLMPPQLLGSEDLEADAEAGVEAGVGAHGDVRVDAHVDVEQETVRGTPAPPIADELQIPIVMYHYTPANFDQQLDYLEQAGYTTVDLEQAAAALRGSGNLPAKPVVLTFDDGFANQMTAFEILKQHNMKATFYIINGGPQSRWCIGAGRRYRDPLQPRQGCGDYYLTWDQVRTLDRSGLITIGGHTLDHANLAYLTPAQQREEIIDSKLEIENEIGHPIYDFAYPYGSYTDTTIEIVQEAGYRTAVTVMPGQYQTAGQAYTLRRVRDAYSLP